jgi:hypothetical protein
MLMDEDYDFYKEKIKLAGIFMDFRVKGRFRSGLPGKISSFEAERRKWGQFRIDRHLSFVDGFSVEKRGITLCSG